MKKLKYIFISAMCIICFGLTSCKPKTPHTHNYVNGVCSCGEKEPHTHSYVNGVCSCGEKDPEYKPLMDSWSFYIDDVLVLKTEAPKGEEPEYPQVPENADENYRWMKMENIINGVTHYELYLFYCLFLVLFVVLFVDKILSFFYFEFCFVCFFKKIDFVF